MTPYIMKADVQEIYFAATTFIWCYRKLRHMQKKTVYFSWRPLQRQLWM